jgi:hypothetical protein
LPIAIYLQLGPDSSRQFPPFGHLLTISRQESPGKFQPWPVANGAIVPQRFRTARISMGQDRKNRGFPGFSK